jgi:hypothetical protein
MTDPRPESELAQLDGARVRADEAIAAAWDARHDPDPYPTTDSYGRPVATVTNPAGRILGYRRNDLPPGSNAAISATPDGAYIAPRPPMARPLTAPERAELARSALVIAARRWRHAAAGTDTESEAAGAMISAVDELERADAPYLAPLPTCPAWVDLSDDRPGRFLGCRLPVDHPGPHSDPRTGAW